MSRVQESGIQDVCFCMVCSPGLCSHIEASASPEELGCNAFRPCCEDDCIQPESHVHTAISTLNPKPLIIATKTQTTSTLQTLQGQHCTLQSQIQLMVIVGQLREEVLTGPQRTCSSRVSTSGCLSA